MRALAFAALLLAAPVSAQTSPATAAQDDPERIAAADALMGKMGLERQYDLILAQMVSLATNQLFDGLEHNNQIPAKLREALSDPTQMAAFKRDFAERFRKAFRARYPEMRAMTDREYARAFTTAELRDLAAFYATPLGQKTLSVMPDLQRRLFPMGVKVGRETGEAAMKATIEHLIPADQRPAA
ncbi:DUF2059 domain-containing protein [Sphingomonas sp. NPDC019816]|uniref:DUF2059 domain-containing protein n=1 Tax=Sphingomonas sp. NPDC019816 TaxID=3390679 RepID=UPI003CFDF239